MNIIREARRIDNRLMRRKGAPDSPPFILWKKRKADRTFRQRALELPSVRRVAEHLSEPLDLLSLVYRLRALSEGPQLPQDGDQREFLRRWRQARSEADLVVRVLRYYAQASWHPRPTRETLEVAAMDIDRMVSWCSRDPAHDFADFSDFGQGMSERAFAIRSVARYVPESVTGRYATIAELVRFALNDDTSPQLVRSTLQRELAE